MPTIIVTVGQRWVSVILKMFRRWTNVTQTCSAIMMTMWAMLAQHMRAVWLFHTSSVILNIQWYCFSLQASIQMSVWAWNFSCKCLIYITHADTESIHTMRGKSRWLLAHRSVVFFFINLRSGYENYVHVKLSVFNLLNSYDYSLRRLI